MERRAEKEDSGSMKEMDGENSYRVESNGVGTLCVPQPSQEQLEKMRPFYARFEINSEADFYKWLDCLDKMVLNDQSADKGGWVFRGQSDASWDIKSSFERSVKEALMERGLDTTEADLLTIERNLIAKFRSRCDEDFDIDQKDLMGWMCAMQHQGVPTRLVDFSVSPLVSLYMSTRKHDSKVNFSVWAVYRPNYQTVYNSRIPWLLSGGECNDELFSCKDIGSMFERNQNTRLNTEKGFLSNWKFANEYLRKGACPDDVIKMNLPKVLWIVPEVVNDRLLNQGGLFLMPMPLEKPTMQQLFWRWHTRDDGRSEAEQFMQSAYMPMSRVDDVVKTTYLIQFVFSDELSDFVSRFLTRANIRGSVLFPDVDGVAEELSDSVKGDTLRFK